SEIPARVGHREHGGPQVRRVRADPDLLRPRGRQEVEEGLMGKRPAERRLADNEAKAFAKTIRVSARKLNLVAESIRGMPAGAAVDSLSFNPRRIAKDVQKVLQSAIANAENNHQLDVDRLYVAEATVGRAMVMK